MTLVIELWDDAEALRVAADLEARAFGLSVWLGEEGGPGQVSEFLEERRRWQTRVRKTRLGPWEASSWRDGWGLPAVGANRYGLTKEQALRRHGRTMDRHVRRWLRSEDAQERRRASWESADDHAGKNHRAVDMAERRKGEM